MNEFGLPVVSTVRAVTGVDFYPPPPPQERLRLAVLGDKEGLLPSEHVAFRSEVETDHTVPSAPPAALHALVQVMLGDNPLGVLRVHLPGLVHRWHEITPWKCMVWVWGGTPSGGGSEDGGLAVKSTGEAPPRTAADVLGA